MKLVIMKGVPGSGKSYKANELAKQLKAFICSADHFFETVVNNEVVYKFNPKRLGQAHQTCKDNCERAMQEKKNVIIDNTNLTYKECKPYISLAKKYGYDCTIVESDTPWKKDAKICSERNTHGVPLEKIQEMMNRQQTVSYIWEQAKELV